MNEIQPAKINIYEKYGDFFAFDAVPINGVACIIV